MVLLLAACLADDKSGNNDGEYSENLCAWLRVEAGRVSVV